MSKSKSFRFFLISLTLNTIAIVTVILLENVGLIFSIPTAYFNIVSWGFRISVIVAFLISIMGFISWLREYRQKKNSKFQIAMFGNAFMIILFLLLVIYFGFIEDHKISYTPPKYVNYLHEEVKIGLADGDTLAGSYTYPNDIKRKIPAVIMITGSSPHDRDNSSPEASKYSYRPFRQMADRLSSNGVATLRMDDHGIGESTGGDIRDMVLPERALDIIECVKYLRNRPEIDGSRICLIGLSEGVSISHMIASKDTLIKGIILLSGIASTGKEICEYQIKTGVMNEEWLIRWLKTDRTVKYFYDFDPLRTVRLVKQPVLIIHGKKDRYVPYTDAYKMKNELNLNGNDRVTLKVLEDHNHGLMKENPDGSVDFYRLPEEVLTIITEWVVKEI